MLGGLRIGEAVIPYPSGDIAEGAGAVMELQATEHRLFLRSARDTISLGNRARVETISPLVTAYYDKIHLRG